MDKRKLDAHPSVVVVRSLDDFIFSIYDEGYPRQAYRLSANNIGGNPEPYSVSPERTLIQEIAEEFDPNHPVEKAFIGKVEWASDRDIRFIRNGLLAEIKPLQDFFVQQKEPIEGGNKPYTAIYSAFYAEIPFFITENVKENLRNGKNIPTEGLIGVYTLRQLENHSKGEFSTAHITAHILNWKYDSKILHPKQLTAEPIGLPRKSYKDYLFDFEYDNENLKKASTADFG
jgi:hypothetical protein